MKDIVSSYDYAKFPFLSDFISSIPRTIKEATEKVSRIDNTIDDNSFNNRKKLITFIQNFHDAAETKTADVISSCGDLTKPETIILLSMHQPNLFAYGGVFKKIILLQKIKEESIKKFPSQKIINIFLIIDHDFIDDYWIRTAELPSIKHTGGILEIKLPRKSVNRWQLVCNTPLPSRSVLEQWKKQIHLWIKSYSKDNRELKYHLDNFREIWTEVEFCYKKSKNYADFNSFIMSRIVNRIWNYDTLFVRISDLSTVFAKGFQFLISNYETYRDVLRHTDSTFLGYNINTGVSTSSYENAPIWIHCNCGSKGSSKLISKGSESYLKGICMSCKKELEIEILGKSRVIPDKKINDISPRAIPILFLLSKELGVGCFGSGTGGSIAYTVVASSVFDKFSVRKPLILIWPAKDKYNGFAQREALKYVNLNDISELQQQIISLKSKIDTIGSKILPLIRERSAKRNSLTSFDNTLDELIKLKKEQDLINTHYKSALRVNGAVGLNPCILDYIINYGIEELENQWGSNLTGNKKLVDPIIFDKPFIERSNSY